MMKALGFTHSVEAAAQRYVAAITGDGFDYPSGSVIASDSWLLSALLDPRGFLARHPRSFLLWTRGMTATGGSKARVTPTTAQHVRVLPESSACRVLVQGAKST